MRSCELARYFGSNRPTHMQPGSAQASSLFDALWIIEATILAVRRFAWLAAAEMPGWDRFPVTFMRQQFNKPGLVFNFFVEDAGSQVVGPRILAKGHIADRAPTSD